jgi:hypothetical protein
VSLTYPLILFCFFQASHRLIEHITPLKEGEKIKVKLNLHKKSTESDQHHDEGKTIPKTGGFAFKPPPAAGSTIFSNLPIPPKDSSMLSSFSPQSNTTAESNTATNDDEWGDFSTSN